MQFMAYSDNQIRWSSTNISSVDGSSSPPSDSGPPLTNIAYTRLALRPTAISAGSSGTSTNSSANTASVAIGNGNRPLSVVERRAFFEKLHAAASTDIPDNAGTITTTTTTTSTTTTTMTTIATTTTFTSDGCSSGISGVSTNAGGISNHRRPYLAKIAAATGSTAALTAFKVPRESTDAKENVIPETLINAATTEQQLLRSDRDYTELQTTQVFTEATELRSPVKKVPPAKPKRTFAHDYEFLQQASFEKKSTEVSYNDDDRLFGTTRVSRIYDGVFQSSSLEEHDKQGEVFKLAPSSSQQKCSSSEGSVLTEEMDSELQERQYGSAEEYSDSIDSEKYSRPVHRDVRSNSTRETVPRSEQKLMRAKSLKEVGEVGKLERLGFDPKLRRCVNRAKLVRRKTLALYNQQEADFCKMTTPQLFDRALNIKLIPKADFPGVYYNDVESAYLPFVSFKYPEEVSKTDTLTDCADLFMPDFTRSRPIQEISQWTENEEFMLTLTDMSGKRSFAYCIKYLRKRPEEDTEYASTSTDGYLPEVFTIVSPINAPPFYLALVRECVNYVEKGQGTLKNFLDAIFRRPFPSKGSSLCLVENPNSLQKREFVIQSQGQELGRANCSSIIDRIGIEVSISIIAALLAEQKVLIGGESVQSVSHAVQTFASLLQPFSWPYVLVPVLPDTLLELAKSPTPCFLGVLRQNLHKLKELLTATRDLDSDDLLKNDVVIVDLDVGIFVPHPSELCSSDPSPDFAERKRRCALALCEKLVLPKKLVLSLVASFKEALSNGPGPHADEMIQKAMLVWFASLLGHYKTFSLPHAYLVDLKGNSTELQAAVYQFIMAHPSKTSRRFIKWFVETGLFRDWLRKKASGPSGSEKNEMENWEDPANRKFDELSQSFAVTCTQGRISNIFTRASTALFRSHILKRL